MNKCVSGNHVTQKSKEVSIVVSVVPPDAASGEKETFQKSLGRYVNFEQGLAAQSTIVDRTSAFGPISR